MKTDMQLKKDVLAELEWDPAIANAAAIGVEVVDGIVTLAGHLNSYSEKLAAERAVERVAGVKGIALDIDISLPGASRHTDTDIATAAADALLWDSLVPKDRVKIVVEDGWITLSGDVSWNYEKSAAESAVRKLRAIRGVINNIHLQPAISPENVKVKIEAALQRAAHLDTKGIEVSVVGGKVTLDGTVHSRLERRLAVDAAWAAPGVTTVLDRLLIAD